MAKTYTFDDIYTAINSLSLSDGTKTGYTASIKSLENGWPGKILDFSNPKKFIDTLRSVNAESWSKRLTCLLAPLKFLSSDTADAIDKARSEANMEIRQERKELKIANKEKAKEKAKEKRMSPSVEDMTSEGGSSDDNEPTLDQRYQYLEYQVAKLTEYVTLLLQGANEATLRPIVMRSFNRELLP